VASLQSKIPNPKSKIGRVGTGFHPTPFGPPVHGGKTGRENITLNEAIPSMRKTEIDHKFDEIVAFAVAAYQSRMSRASKRSNKDQGGPYDYFDSNAV